MTDGLTAKVLCVDDTLDVAESTALVLQTLGFDAKACTDGQTALDVAAGFHPDACVLDISMPGMGGYELARRLRVLLGTVFLVAVTGTSGGEHDKRLVEAGFNLRLIKSADPMVLLAVLKKAAPHSSAA